MKNKKKTTEVLEQLAVRDLVPSKDNPRFISEKSDGFKELVASIKGQGVIIPVHVRPHPTIKGKFDLLAGERRVRAAKAAKLETVPAINRGEITDEQAFEITFAENFVREDLTPLEQGKAVVTLYDKYNGDTQAVASKLGRSIKWVLRRRALGTKLSQPWQEAILKEGQYGKLQYWTAAHLQLIASLPEPMQAELLEYHEMEEEVPTVKALESQIAEMLQLLSLAPFNPEVAGCIKCQKRTSCQPGLFDDKLDDAAIKKNDRCLDRLCWNTKIGEWLKATYEAKKVKLSNLLPISTEYLDDHIKRHLIEAFPQVVEHYHYSQASKKDKGSVPGFIIHGKALGTILWIKPSGSATAKAAKKTKGTPTPLRVRRRMLDKKRYAGFLEAMKEVVKGKTPADLVAKDKTAMVLALADTFGVKESYSHSVCDFSDDGAGVYAPWKRLAKLSKQKMAEVRARLWANVLPQLLRVLDYMGPVTQTPYNRVKAAESLAGLVGIDTKPLLQKIVEELPEPKAWAKLNEDGTPKTTGKKQTKKPAKSKTAKKTSPGKKSEGSTEK